MYLHYLLYISHRILHVFANKTFAYKTIAKYTDFINDCGGAVEQYTEKKTVLNVELNARLMCKFLHDYLDVRRTT